ncbi:cold shock domain-containing protein C2 isoform X1 [Oxyura jamaicensis]|nr:cold shock domain-containing protein C2 isoform X1 [Oxyura jamaicensis]XP_035167077.1 cold shock domain-containing protein C2 isoform X1 [Oxyura jamaicensis]
MRVCGLHIIHTSGTAETSGGSRQPASRREESPQSRATCESAAPRRAAEERLSPPSADALQAPAPGSPKLLRRPQAADPSPPPTPKTEEPPAPAMSSEPGAPPAVPPLHSPKSPVWPTFPFQREGSRVWERGNLLLRDLPSPLPTKRTRTYSATARASAGPIFKGVCKQFSRSQGHGFITPENGTEDIFVHVSDIEGEYVPVEGDEVTYKVCPIPPKNQKFQAVEVVLTNLAPHTKHETWSGQIIGS